MFSVAVQHQVFIYGFSSKFREKRTVRQLTYFT